MCTLVSQQAKHSVVSGKDGIDSGPRPSGVHVACSSFSLASSHSHSSASMVDFAAAWS